MSNPVAADPIRSIREELPLHAEWVRRLARGLVRDGASADDLAQDVALAALRSEHAIRGPLRPWLSRVTLNLARKSFRSAATRDRGEREAARGEASAAQDDASERLEVQRALVEELAAIAEPFRTALIRRYFDRWSAARIARATGVPAPTVRWRLQRGLAELRERLDRRSSRDGITWRLALLPLCRGLPPVPFSPMEVMEGVLAMKVSTQVIAAGAVVLAIGWGVWRHAASDEPARAESAHATMAAQLTADEPPITVVHEPVAQHEATSRAAVPVASVSTPGPEVTAPIGWIEGRCIDEALIPIVGALIANNELPSPLLARDGRVAESRRDGTFTLDCPPVDTEPRVFRVEARGYGTHFVKAIVPRGETAHLGDLILSAGGAIRGRVVDANGNPFADASVVVTDPDLWGDQGAAQRLGPQKQVRAPAVRTDTAGRFHIEDVAVGMRRVWASAPKTRFGVSPPIEVRANVDTEEIELVLQPAEKVDRITLVVQDPSGAPVPGAWVQLVERAAFGTRGFGRAVDENGYLDLETVPNATYDFTAYDERDRWPRVSVAGVAPGSRDVELRFVDSEWIDVVARSEGTTVEDFELATRETEKDVIVTRGDAGRVRTPTEPFFVEIDARGFEIARQGPFDPSQPPKSVEFDLVPAPCVLGRVMFDGEPIGGASVELYEVPSGQRIVHQGYLSLLSPRALDQVTTRADGRFALRLRQSGTFVVRAESEGFAPRDVGPLELGVRGNADELEIVLSRGGAIEGRVLMPAGRDSSGVIVAINRGDARPRTMRSDADGRFRFDQVTAGRWHVARGNGEARAGVGSMAITSTDEPTKIPFNCDVIDGESTRHDVDLRDWEPCEVSGKLLVNGAPASGWLLTVWPGTARAVAGPLPSTAVGPRGEFSITLDDPGLVRFAFRPPAEEASGGQIESKFELRPGLNEWSSDFAMGKVTGTIAAGLNTERVVYKSVEGADPACILPLTPDAEGRFALPFVPAGRGAISQPEVVDGEVRWNELATVNVVARGEQRVDVR